MGTLGKTWRRRWEDVDDIQAYLLTRRQITMAGCWEFTGARRNGYGTVRIDTRAVGAHVAALWAWQGIRTNGGRHDVVRHTCDNPCCFNPAHLRRSTQHENIQDAISKGRRPRRGEATHCQQGHAFSPTNTYWFRGYQRCRMCRAQAEREHRRQVKGML